MSAPAHLRNNNDSAVSTSRGATPGEITKRREEERLRYIQATTQLNEKNRGPPQVVDYLQLEEQQFRDQQEQWQQQILQQQQQEQEVPYTSTLLTKGSTQTPIPSHDFMSKFGANEKSFHEQRTRRLEYGKELKQQMIEQPSKMKHLQALQQQQEEQEFFLLDPSPYRRYPTQEINNNNNNNNNYYYPDPNLLDERRGKKTKAEEYRAKLDSDREIRNREIQKVPERNSAALIFPKAKQESMQFQDPRYTGTALVLGKDKSEEILQLREKQYFQMQGLDEQRKINAEVARLENLRIQNQQLTPGASNLSLIPMPYEESPLNKRQPDQSPNSKILLALQSSQPPLELMQSMTPQELDKLKKLLEQRKLSKEITEAANAKPIFTERQSWCRDRQRNGYQEEEPYLPLGKTTSCVIGGAKFLQTEEEARMEKIHQQMLYHTQLDNCTMAPKFDYTQKSSYAYPKFQQEESYQFNELMNEMTLPVVQRAPPKELLRRLM